jgi:hypothetical protein
MFLYKLLKINPSFILDISIEPIFSKNSNILEIIDEVIERIETEREEERIEKEEKKLEEQKNIEYNMNLNELKNKLKKNEEDLDYEYIKQNSYNIKSNS